MSKTLTVDEQRELEKLRKANKVHKLNSKLSLFGIILHLILMVIIAVVMMQKGFDAKTAWLVGGLAPSVIWWLLSFPIF